MGESICKWNNQQGINLQSIQTAHISQYQRSKKKKKSKKWTEDLDLNKLFSKEDMQMAKRDMENVQQHKFSFFKIT